MAKDIKNPTDCVYFSCHVMKDGSEFECIPEMCYCPVFPCKDKSLGYWIKEGVWDCSFCTVNHTKEFFEEYKKLMKHLN